MECGMQELIETLRELFSTVHNSAFVQTLNTQAKQEEYIRRFERKVELQGWPEVSNMVKDLEKKLLMSAMFPNYAAIRDVFLHDCDNVTTYEIAVRQVRNLQRMVAKEKKRNVVAGGGNPNRPSPKSTKATIPSSSQVTRVRSACDCTLRCAELTSRALLQAQTLERAIERLVQEAGLSDRLLLISDARAGVTCKLKKSLDDDTEEEEEEQEGEVEEEEEEVTSCAPSCFCFVGSLVLTASRAGGRQSGAGSSQHATKQAYGPTTRHPGTNLLGSYPPAMLSPVLTDCMPIPEHAGVQGITDLHSGRVCRVSPYPFATGCPVDDAATRWVDSVAYIPAAHGKSRKRKKPRKVPRRLFAYARAIKCLVWYEAGVFCFAGVVLT
eukprot:2606381-Rhodomonas_salina.1